MPIRRRHRRITLLTIVDHLMVPSRTRLARTTATPVMDPCMDILRDLRRLRLTEDTLVRLADIMVVIRMGEGTRTALPALRLHPGMDTPRSLIMAFHTLLSP